MSNLIAAENEKIRAISGPYHYTDGNGGMVLHLPTTLTQNVKVIDEEGTKAIDLQSIINEQFAMMELGLKKDICNLYVSTQGLHGNEIQLSGNSTVISVSEHRKSMNVVGEVDPNLPYIEV